MTAKVMIIFINLLILFFLPGPKTENNYWILVVIPISIGAALITYSIHNIWLLHAVHDKGKQKRR